MWRPRDRERFIGGYDPEHEMPDPYRDPRDRWQSDAYRHNARDSRFAYRWNPDRVESRRYEGDYDRGWSFDRNYDRDRGYGYGYDDRGFRGDYAPEYGAGDYGERYGGGWYRGRGERPSSIYGTRYDRDQGGYGYGSDRGWDHDRGFGFQSGRGGWDRDRDRGYDRGYDRDRWDRDRDRGYDRGFDEDREWRNRRY